MFPKPLVVKILLSFENSRNVLPRLESLCLRKERDCDEDHAGEE